MFCPKCGKENPEDSTFCESCGARMTTAPVRRGANPPVPQVSREQLGAMLLKSMTLGEKFTAVGSLAGILGFFLPWGSLPNFGSFDPTSLLGGARTLSTSAVSGLDMARMWGGFYLLLVGPVIAGVLFFLAGKASTEKKLTTGAFQILIGSLVGPQMLSAILFMPMGQQVAGLGLWLSALGYSAIAAGGIISIAQLARKV